MKKTLISMALLAALPAVGSEADAYDGIERITIQGQYLSVNQANSIKSPTPVIDVPQSLSIFTEDDIIARGFTSIGQMIDYTPGVNTSQGEGHRDAVVFRGIRSTADFFIDGNRDDVQYYRALYNIEQVEILRGPNALLFGRGGTGGVLNRVTKKARLDEQFTNYLVSANSFGAFNTQIDTNFEASDNAAIRVNAMYEKLENHRDFFDGDRYGFNPTARIELAEDTVLDVSYEYINHERFIDRGIPTGSDGRPATELRNIVFGDPENNYDETEAHVFRANLDHQFNDHWKGNFSAFYGDFDKVYANFYATGYDEVAGTAELDGYIDVTKRDNLILSTNIVGEFNTGGVEHTLIFGGEYIRTNSDQDRFNPEFDTKLARIANGEDVTADREDFFIARPLNFRGFVGVNANGNPTNGPFTDLNDDTRVDLDVHSFYVQDEIALSENFDLVLGARFDSFDITVLNAVSGEVRTRKDEEVSPRAGLIYKPQENISIYASYGESFLPRSGEQYANINGNNNQLDPNTFKNQEIGIKWDFETGLSLTAAVFENEQSSPQAADNDPATLDVIDSEITGFELQLLGRITDDWSVNANYSYLDGEIVDRLGDTGRTPREVPENTFSIWSTYAVSDVFGVGLGATYQDETFINNSNSAVLPSYTRFDASAYYDLPNDMRVQVNLENLTDKEYFPNAHSTHQATVGAPFNARLTLTGSF